MAPKKSTGKVKMSTTNEKLAAEFYPAIVALGNCEIKNVDLLTKIVRAKRTVKNHLNEFDEIRKNIQEKYCVKDANDEPVLEDVPDSDAKKYKYKTEKIENETADLVKDLMTKEVIIEVHPIKATALRNTLRLSANILEQLEDFIIFE